MSETAAGATLEATEITPRPPSDIRGSVTGSSPERTSNSSPQRLITSLAMFIESVASFVPTMFGISARRAVVSAVYRDARAAWDVVEDEGKVRALGYGGEVAVEALLGRLVVVGGDLQGAVGAYLLGHPGVLDRHVRRVGARARDYGHPPVRDPDDGPYDEPVLLLAHGRRLAGGAAGDEAVDALLYLELDHPLQGLDVYLPVPERGDEGRERAAKHLSPPVRSPCASPLPPLLPCSAGNTHVTCISEVETILMGMPASPSVANILRRVAGAVQHPRPDDGDLAEVLLALDPAAQRVGDLAREPQGLGEVAAADGEGHVGGAFLRGALDDDVHGDARFGQGGEDAAHGAGAGPDAGQGDARDVQVVDDAGQGLAGLQVLQAVTSRDDRARSFLEGALTWISTP